MLTHLRFKNWRSLKDVEINDLTPITVFIGANSSGKTNILDGLHFLRYAATHSMVEAITSRRGYDHIHTIGVDENEPIEIEVSLKHPTDNILLGQTLELVSADPFHQMEFSVEDRENVIVELEPNTVDEQASPKIESSWESETPETDYKLFQYTRTFITRRWQLLGENFLPKLVQSTENDPGDSITVEADARNIAYISYFMSKNHPEIYANLVDDFKWLLGHISILETVRDERETRVLIREKAHKNRESPTISSGTARIFAILTAFYALNMDNPKYRKLPSDGSLERIDAPLKEMPGLVVIEEPDTALNPLLLKRFMELIRSYVDGEHPRQVIMTTHNPHFLDLFQPEEVRIVERDDQGYTTVNRVPEDIKDIWLDEYGLGEVWTTRSLGGVPE